jgi:Arc/MetJ-type ribon-helix-helix transcriptional regulator
MHQEMRMTRLTITFDDDTVEGLDSLPLAELQAAVMARLDSVATTGDQAAFVARLSHSLEELGEDPSASAVVREALDFFLAALRDAERDARLEAGYALIADEPNRERMLEAIPKRAPKRMADEP